MEEEAPYSSCNEMLTCISSHGENFEAAASEINIRCKELSLTTRRLWKTSCTLCSANKNSKNINQSDICLKILKIILVSFPKDAYTTYSD